MRIIYKKTILDKLDDLIATKEYGKDIDYIFTTGIEYGAIKRAVGMGGEETGDFNPIVYKGIRVK